MNLQEFLNKNDGVGLDFDGYFGDQCVDLIQFYNRDVIGGPVLTGNAKDIWNTYPKDFYIQIGNTPDNFPQSGNIIIWNGNVGEGNGHISIVVAGNSNAFSSFDQNWPIGSFCHFENHNYDNVIGWLVPKNQPQDLQQQLAAKNKAYDELYTSDQENLHTISQQKDLLANLTQIVNDRNADITTLNAEVQKKETELQARDQELSIVKPIAATVPALQEKAATQQALTTQADIKIQGLRDGITKLTQSNAQLANTSAWTVSKQELVQIFIKRLVGAKQ